MASRGGNASDRSQEWQWDSSRRLYYYYNRNTSEYVYEDGSRIPRRATPAVQQNAGQVPTANTQQSGSANYGPTSGGSDLARSVFVDRSPDFFRRYRVFALQPSQSSGVPQSTATVLSNLVPAQYGEDATIRGVQRFVVVKEPLPGETYCIALPISSYGGQGTKRAGVLKHFHGVIYIGRREPDRDPDEEPRRHEQARGMMPNAIRVDPHLPTERLHRYSRINYAQPTPILVSARVHEVGLVHRDSQAWLISQYNVVKEQRAAVQQQRTVPESSRAASARSPQQQIAQPVASSSRTQSSASALAREAARIQREYGRLLGEGHDHSSAISALAEELRDKHEGWDWDDAIRGVMSRLSYRSS